MTYDDILGPPVDPRYLRAVQRQREAPKRPPIACTPTDLEAIADDGHLGLLTVLAEAGWVLYERRTGERVVLWAEGSSYAHGTSGVTQEDRAVALFKELYSDDPGAIAVAQSFWPPRKERER